MKEHETVYLGCDLCLLCYVHYFSFLPAFFDLLIVFVCISSYVNLLVKQKPALSPLTGDDELVFHVGAAPLNRNGPSSASLPVVIRR